VLGDLGADVLKGERPGTGDDTRRWGPPFSGGDAASYLAVNRNRRSLTLDLRDPDGAAIVRCLARHADVVVENFLPRHLAGLGLESLRDERTAVWVSVRGAGGDGPDADLPGYDVMVQARSGLMGITGFPGTGPVKVGVAIDDVVTGLYAAVAALAGLVGRRASPRGPAPSARPARAPAIEVPLLECAISALVNQAANYLIGGVVPGLLGNDHPNLAPYGPLECADRPLVVGAGNDAQYARLCAAIGRDDLAADPRFATNADRLAHRAALTGALTATLRTAPAADWQARLEAAGVPCAQVNTLDAVFADPHVTAVGLVQEVKGLRLVRSPLRVNGASGSIRRPPPALGEHTDEILAALGIGSEAIAALRARGAC